MALGILIDGVAPGGGVETSYGYPDVSTWEITTGPATWQTQRGSVFRVGNKLYSMYDDDIYSCPIDDVTNWSSQSLTISSGTWPTTAKNAVFVNNDAEKVYLYGGRYGSSTSSDIFEASFSDLTTWASIGTYTVGSYSSCLVGSNNRVYIYGGGAGASLTSGKILSAPVNDPTNITSHGTTPSGGKDHAFLYVFDGLAYKISNGNIMEIDLADPSTVSNSGADLPDYDVNFSEFMQIGLNTVKFGTSSSDGASNVCVPVLGWKDSDTFYADPPTNLNESSSGGGWYYDQDGRLYVLTGSSGAVVRSGTRTGYTYEPIVAGEYHRLPGRLADGGNADLYPEMRYQAIWWNTYPLPF
jgi:hypothetical protein